MPDNISIKIGDSEEKKSSGFFGTIWHWLQIAALLFMVFCAWIALVENHIGPTAPDTWHRGDSVIRSSS